MNQKAEIFHFHQSPLDGLFYQSFFSSWWHCLCVFYYHHRHHDWLVCYYQVLFGGSTITVPEFHAEIKMAIRYNLC